MAKVLPPVFPEQDLPLPPSLREWLPENHLAYFVSEIDQWMELLPQFPS